MASTRQVVGGGYRDRVPDLEFFQAESEYFGGRKKPSVISIPRYNKYTGEPLYEMDYDSFKTFVSDVSIIKEYNITYNSIVRPYDGYRYTVALMRTKDGFIESRDELCPIEQEEDNFCIPCTGYEALQPLEYFGKEIIQDNKVFIQLAGYCWYNCDYGYIWGTGNGSYTKISREDALAERMRFLEESYTKRLTTREANYVMRAFIDWQIKYDELGHAKACDFASALISTQYMSLTNRTKKRLSQTQVKYFEFLVNNPVISDAGLELQKVGIVG